jgi:hypothetical protein
MNLEQEKRIEQEKLKHELNHCSRELFDEFETIYNYKEYWLIHDIVNSLSYEELLGASAWLTRREREETKEKVLQNIKLEIGL